MGGKYEGCPNSLLIGIVPNSGAIDFHPQFDAAFTSFRPRIVFHSSVRIESHLLAYSLPSNAMSISIQWRGYQANPLRTDCK
ncbi:MAG: hypothetical protein JWP89_851 [Schlesneria sp.]|nr:hypothetical protein [Schlesneria sp.]